MRRSVSVQSKAKPISTRLARGIGKVFGIKPKKVKSKAGSMVGGVAVPKSTTFVQQTLADVLILLGEDRAARIAVYGPRAFRDQVQDALRAEPVAWFSNDPVDLLQGAKIAVAALFDDLDTVVVGGPDVALSFRQAVRLVHMAKRHIPVHWVAPAFEFCAGTLAVPAEAENCDALLFNHFQQFFGVKDPLCFKIEAAYMGKQVRRYAVLGPDQSLNIDLNEILPERQGTATVKVLVAHPTLTRGRHYRLRLCADVFWRGSHTIVHGSHQFFKSPDKRQEFRLIDQVVRRGRVIMTVPNYDLDMGKNATVDYVNGTDRRQLTRRPDRRAEEIMFQKDDAASEGLHYYSVGYHGFGTSFWYALEEGIDGPAGKANSIAGNHLCRVGLENRADVLMTPAEQRHFAAIEAAGFMIHPCTLPIVRGTDQLAFGFNFDASNPPFADYVVRFYDDGGRYLGTMNYRKDFLGPAFIDDILAKWSDPAAARAASALVSPDWQKTGYAPHRFVTTADLVCRHLKTGDQDMTEFQSSWRNIGVDIPLLPHWLHPSIGVLGRTNVIGRARTKGGHRTGVLISNASGNLDYRTQAAVTISVRNRDGVALNYDCTLAPFTCKLIWLDDVLPALSAHLGPSGIGALVVSSGDADLCAQVLSLSPSGSVGLQHLWGY